MTFARRFHTALMGLVLAAGFGGAALAADLVVLEASGVALRAGQIVDSNQKLTLKQGQHVTLISPAGVTLKLDGPYEGAPAAEQGRGVTAANAFALLVTQRQARLGEVGTTRGAAPSVLPEPWLLDASRAGTVCLRTGTDAVLWRPDPAQQAELSVIPADRSWRADTHWPAGADRIMIATPAVIRGGTTYFVRLNGAQSGIKVEDVPAVLSNDSMRAAWLANKGCEAQARALLRNGK